MWQLSETVIYDPATGITYYLQGPDVQVCSVHDSTDVSMGTKFRYEEAKALWAFLLKRVADDARPKWIISSDKGSGGGT